MSAEARPFRLECWEMDPDAAEETWRLWSTYVTEKNALERRDKLAAKGHTARVVSSVTGEVFEAAPAPRVCSFCGSAHDEPHDGSCLL